MTAYDSLVNFISYRFNSMYTVKHDKLPLVLRCIWYQVCRFRDYEKSGTISTQEIMRHSASIHNQFKSYTSWGNYSINITLNSCHGIAYHHSSFSCYYATQDTNLQSGPAPSKWAKLEVTNNLLVSADFLPSLSRLCTNELRITYFLLADSRETIGSASWFSWFQLVASRLPRSSQLGDLLPS